MKATIIRQLAIVLLLCQMLTSCYSYRSVLTETAISSSTPFPTLISGNIYQIKYKTGEKKLMKVIKVDNDYLYGTIYTDNPFGETLEAADSRLPLNQVADVKEKKSNHALTVAAILIPVSLLLVIAIQMNPFTYSFNWKM